MIDVDGKKLSDEDFKKLQEQINEDKTKKLKKIKENEYRTLVKMNG